MPDATLNAIRSIYLANGGAFLVLPNFSRYPRSAFFDTAEHLNETWQIAHSKLLAEQLRWLRAPIAELAIRHRLPTIGDSRDSVRAGQLIGYGTNFEDQYRRSASYVDRILKGAKPSDLPVERPEKFDLAFNLNTAQAIGVTVPPAMLQQATDVIQ